MTSLPASRPEPPDGWIFDGRMDCISCDECAFSMASVHAEINKPTTCPVCEEAALRARCADLELIARDLMERTSEVEENPWGIDSVTGEWIHAFWNKANEYVENRMPDDGTRLPLLTDEARRALKGDAP